MYRRDRHLSYKMLLLLVLTLLAYESKGLEDQVDSHAKPQNFPSKAGETLLHYPYSLLVHPGQNQNPLHEVIGVKAETPCSTEVVRIEQSQTGTLPGGLPIFTEQIVNGCSSGCSIHLSCASFRSEKVINPKVLRRIAPDDCFLNYGQPLPSGQTITFEYASATPIPVHGQKSYLLSMMCPIPNLINVTTLAKILALVTLSSFLMNKFLVQ